jgi:hypothetical protein
MLRHSAERKLIPYNKNLGPDIATSLGFNRDFLLTFS